MQKVTNIDCPYFKKQDQIIFCLTETINVADSAAEKKSLVHENLEEISVLLNCSDFSDESNSCLNCKTVMTERKEAGELILKGLELSHYRG